MTTLIHLDAVELLESGRVAVTIGEDPDGRAPFIYRAAAEVAWEPDARRFVSPRPGLGPPAKHYAHIAAAVADELGWHLYVSPRTRWVNVPEDLRSAIEASARGA